VTCTHPLLFPLSAEAKRGNVLVIKYMEKNMKIKSPSFL
jgi:hypothetical protein